MAVTRWNPWGELFTLADSMDQLVARSLLPDRGMAMTHLPLDIRQTDDAYVIEASVPGFSPEQVDITYGDNVLTIRAHHTQDDAGASDQGGYVRRERRAVSFYRQVGLPAEVRADGISAQFENGVLTITVPRAQRAQPRRIAVTSATVEHSTLPPVGDGQGTVPAIPSTQGD